MPLSLRAKAQKTQTNTPARGVLFKIHPGETACPLLIRTKHKGQQGAGFGFITFHIALVWSGCFVFWPRAFIHVFMYSTRVFVCQTGFCTWLLIKVCR